MKKIRPALRFVVFFTVPLALAVPAVVHTAPAPKKAVEPAADQKLKEMTEYLAGLKSFKVQGASVDEVVLKSGEKIELAADSAVSVERPKKLRSEQIGQSGLSFWYDGKTMSLYCKASNSYGAVPAPATIDGMIDAARKQFHLEAPGADLLFSQPYDILMEQVKGGQLIGHETVEGVPVTHLAFQGEDVDWQIWIQDGAQPLPLRFVITTKTMKERPEFSVQLSHWEPEAVLAPATFDFDPPSGAKKVESLPTTCHP